MPERMRNSQVCRLTSLISERWEPKKTIPHVIKRITVVRMAVARLELMSLTPTLAKMAVRAAKKAESYLEIMSFSTSGLISQLEFEGFTHSQAVYGADHAGQ